MKFETVEIEDLATAKGVVPATLHYFEDQEVHLRIIEESPSVPNESGLREILEEALKDHENDRKWLLEKYPQVKDIIDTAVRPWIEKARKALSQYSSPSQPEGREQEEVSDEDLQDLLWKNSVTAGAMERVTGALKSKYHITRKQ